MPKGQTYTRDELLAMQDTDLTRYLSLSKKRKDPEILEDRVNFVEKRQKTKDAAASPSSAASSDIKAEWDNVVKSAKGEKNTDLATTFNGARTKTVLAPTPENAETVMPAATQDNAAPSKGKKPISITEAEDTISPPLKLFLKAFSRLAANHVITHGMKIKLAKSMDNIRAAMNSLENHPREDPFERVKHILELFKDVDAELEAFIDFEDFIVPKKELMYGLDAAGFSVELKALMHATKKV